MADKHGEWIVTHNRFSFGYRCEHAVRDVASCMRHDYDPDIPGDSDRAIAACQAECDELNRTHRGGFNPAHVLPQEAEDGR